MKQMAWIAVLALVLVGPSLQAAQEVDKDKDPASLRTSFDKSMNTVITNYDATVKNWPNNYVNAIKALQAKLQKDGNLEGWTEAKAELDRFQADQKIEDANLSNRPEIQAIQVKFKEIPAQASIEKNQKIVSLSQKYVAKLTALQTCLTKQGKMEDAIAVNTEIKRVRTSPDVVAAELEIEKHDAAQKK